MSAADLKEQGNRFFGAHKYEEAIGCYSKAILKNSSDGKFFTNRSLCKLKLRRFDAAAEDCRLALELDQNNVKAHCFLGHALLEQELYDESIASLSKAHDLAKELKLNYGDDIACTLRSAKKKRWSAMEEKRIQQEILLQSFLNRLVLDDKERQMAELKIDDEKDTKEESEDQKQQIETDYDKHIKELNELFAAVDERRKTREVPDYLCGKISFEIMKDPVITPSGITYDKKDIEEHLQRVGHFDPVTRIKLTQDQLIPNLAMKEVIATFLDENEWVEEY
ncbi:STIP1 homology and U box-containing protein 1-like [Asterias rubens]|uniref:STIP1 homology and U box-containing protein 1-like n=1 Tax=Asterias rubens TaxID=7604 RepID=UPI0014559050|nr:STIP1 homology and U box-containing protein 1-like [Asterias rubens]